MNMETMIVGLIGMCAAVYLLRRWMKALGGKTGCACSGTACCGNQCSEKDAMLRRDIPK